MGNTHSTSKYQNRTMRSMPFGPYDTKIEPHTAQKVQGHSPTTPTFQAEIKKTLPQFWIQKTLRPGQQQRGKCWRGRSAAAQERPQQGRGGNPERRKPHAPPGRRGNRSRRHTAVTKILLAFSSGFFCRHGFTSPILEFLQFSEMLLEYFERHLIFLCKNKSRLIKLPVCLSVCMCVSY
jgi:hypothetical protein